VNARSTDRRRSSGGDVSRRVLLGGLAAMPVLACSTSDVDLPARPLRIATGNKGGVYVDYGNGIAAAIRERLPMLRVEVVQTQGSVKNLKMVADGTADVAFSLADASADAVRGIGSFEKALRLAALARLYDNYAHVVVRDEMPFRVIRDLAGQTVSTGPRDSGTSLLAGRLLEAAGLVRERDVREEQLNLETSTEKLRAGEIAVLFWSGGLPTKAIQDLVRTTDVRLLDLSDVAVTLAQTHDAFVRTTLPASAYGLAPVTTLSVSNYLVVRAEEDAELAYQLTRLLFTERDRIEHPEARRLNLRSAISTYPLELHRGAERYYREAKD
jgi:TRAP transporter TAXI family solute receptor